MPAYSSSDLMKLIVEACQKANLNPEVPSDIRLLHRSINEGREQADRIGDTYIYKKIYSERKKENLNLGTRFVDLIAQYLGYDTFSQYQASLPRQVRQATPAACYAMETDGESPMAHRAPIPIVVLGGGAPPVAIHQQVGLVWTEQPMEEILRGGQASRAVVVLPSYGPEDWSESEMDRWDALFREAYHKLPLLFVGVPELVQRWSQQLPCISWHRSASLQQSNQIRAFIDSEALGKESGLKGMGHTFHTNVEGNENTIFNNPQGPITINNQRK